MGEISIDVIVNNCNYARYLRDAIDSALEQTYPHVSVIVVDDGSTDESREVIGSYAGDVVAILKENGGQASALNAGIEHSSADAVVFLDSDDMLVPDVGERIAAAFSANSKLGMVQYPMEVIDGGGRRTGARKPPPHVPLRSGDLRKQKLTFPFDVAWMATSGNAYAQWSLRRIFPIPEQDFALGADFYLNHLVPLLGPVRTLDAPGAYYRVHGLNRHEPTEARIDLDNLRQTILYTDRVRHRLAKLARQECLHIPSGNFLSVSDVAGRLTSIRLDRDRHPIRGDTRARLFVSGVRAVFRRFDIRWPMKMLFLVWFAAMTVAPRRLAHSLAERFFFPERRAMLNRVLAAFHRFDHGEPYQPAARTPAEGE